RAPVTRIEAAPKAGYEHADCEDREEDRASGRYNRPGSSFHQVLRLIILRLVSPLGDIERNANTDEGNRREGHQHGPDVKGIVDGDRLQDVPNDVADQNPQVG